MAVLYPDLSYQIIGAAMEVHKVLGPGYLETVYQTALAHELNLRVIKYEREKHLPVVYKGIHVGYYIADFVVEEKIILELKSVTLLTKQHKAQAINYLVTTGFKLAILINFGERSLTYERIIHKAKL